MLFLPYKRFIAGHDLLREGDGVVLAVSGGIDSMVMLDLFTRLAKPWKLALTVAHVNYGLRGRSSDLDERFVRDACAERGIRFECLRHKMKKGPNLQGEARRVRYHFLGEVAARSGARIIATAHQRDDQAETILLHLLRGSGLRGLAGMAAKTTQGPVVLVRPLLFAERREIAAYAKQRLTPSREDKTNTQTAYTRNRVRHLLIPALKKFNPQIVEALASMGERLHEDDLALSLVAEEAFREAAASVEPGCAVLRREAFVFLPRGVRVRLLRQAFEKASGSSADLNADQLATMDAIALGKRPAGSYRLHAPWKFERAKDFLTIRKSSRTHDR